MSVLPDGQSYPPHASADDRALFDRAAALPPDDWRSIDVARLRAIALEHGTDVATAWWCARVRVGNAGLVEALERDDASPSARCEPASGEDKTSPSARRPDEPARSPDDPARERDDPTRGRDDSARRPDDRARRRDDRARRPDDRAGPGNEPTRADAPSPPLAGSVDERIHVDASFPPLAGSQRVERVLLIPGAFHRQHRNSGADGRRLIDLANQSGFRASAIPTPSFAPVERNARVIVEHVRRERAPVILVSLSKGSRDVALALAHQDVSRNVAAWLDVSGLLPGTKLIDWLAARPLRRIGVTALLWAHGMRYRTLRGLAPAMPSAAPVVPTFHLIACPLRRHLRHRWAPRAYDRLAPHGPSDGGGVLLGDACALPGQVYPVWGADHYLLPDWDVEPLVRRALRHAAQSANAPAATPAGRSSA